MTWGNPETPQEKMQAALLTPAAAGFGLGLYTRLMAYNWKFLKQTNVGVPVISVGNITVGGTGKTPVTIDIAQRLTQAGHKVGVLSRGYKRVSRDPILVVSDGKGDIQSCLESGDEPYLIAKSVPEAVVIVGSKRIQTAPLAISKYGCDVLVLDDGFQHFAIARNTDIVLVDYKDDLTKDSLLPAGRLREPLGSLARADWVVLTKVPHSPDLDRLQRIRSTIAQYAPNAEVTSCRISPHAVNYVGSERPPLELTSLRGMKALLFSGIARPEIFTQQMEELGVEVVGRQSFGDHHWYKHQDIDSLRDELQRTGANLMITTEKDAVKLHPDLIKGLPIAAIRQKLEWLGPLPLTSAKLPANAGAPLAAATKSDGN